MGIPDPSFDPDLIPDQYHVIVYYPAVDSNSNIDANLARQANPLRRYNVREFWALLFRQTGVRVRIQIHDNGRVVELAVTSHQEMIDGYATGEIRYYFERDWLIDPLVWGNVEKMKMSLSPQNPEYRKSVLENLCEILEDLYRYGDIACQR